MLTRANTKGKVAEKRPMKPKKNKRKKARSETYHHYIRKLLKQISPDIGITGSAMSVMNSFVEDTFERIATEAGRIVKYNKKNTLMYRDIQAAVRLLIPGELGEHATSEGAKAISNYNSSVSKK